MAAGGAVFRRLPVVVVLGSTGTGKSKLAIEIAKRVGGEIVSADSMQVYKGLDIITNKVSSQEMAECPHHMLAFVSPPKEFSVVEYRDMALPLIYDIQKRGKVPIIVGGTNYYIEALLWDVLINKGSGCTSQRTNTFEDSSSDTDTDEGSEVQKNIKKRKKIQRGDQASAIDEEDSLDIFRSDCNSTHLDAQNTSAGGFGRTRTTSENLYEILQQVDPDMAERLHPNDTRKIARSLQVYEQSGIQHSKLILEQQEKLGGNTLGGPLRFDFTCVFWLQCERGILNERLDKRVDEMLQKGLLKELLDFHREYSLKTCGEKGPPQYTEGIFQSIGFKEFHQFLIRQHSCKSADETVLSKEDKQLLAQCIDVMKCATRRYAKKQVTWVRNRFLGRPENCSPDVFGLDATYVDHWKDNVLNKAMKILECLIEGSESSIKPLGRVLVNLEDRKHKHVCQVCDNRIIIGEDNWKKHLVSRSHKWHIKKNKRNLEEHVVQENDI